jgi:hypothetical protein
MSTHLLSPTRREVLIATAALGATSMLSSKSYAATGVEAIRPFQFRASDADLADL